MLATAPALLLAGCGGEMSILDPSGPAARSQYWVWWAMLIVSLVVSVALFSLWLYTFWRKAPPPERTAQQEHRIMLRWVLGVAWRCPSSASCCCWSSPPPPGAA